MGSDLERAVALLDRAEELDAEGRHEEEMAVYDEVIRRFDGRSDPEVIERVLQARLDKAITLYDLDREEEALVLLEDLRERRRGPTDDRFRWVFARTAKYEAYALQVLGRTTEALARYDDLEAQFGDADDPSVLADVAQGLREKASVLWGLDRPDESLATSQRVTQRFGAIEDDELGEEVALSSADLAHRLLSLERAEDALEAYDLACRCDDLDAGELARALYGRGCALETLGRHDDAIAQFTDVVVRFADDDDAIARLRAAWAGNWRGTLLWRAGLRAEAITAHRRVADLAAGDEDPDLRAECARALLELAACLTQESRTDEAITTYDEFLVAFSGDDAFASDVDQALRYKLALLAGDQRTGETIVVANALSERMAIGAGAPAHVEATMSFKGAALFAEGRFEEAIEAFESAAAAVAESPDSRLRAAAGLALYNKAAALVALDRTDEAVGLQQESADRFGTDMLDALDARLQELGPGDHTETLLERAQVRLRRGQTLGLLGRTADAVEGLGQLLEDTEDDADEPAIAELRSLARMLREHFSDDE